ncbi:hypothetical protein GCM10008995_08560 [Halobellus salinus]|uniref:Zinc ribbon domain-containing protein n=1 Tax=Halobellus salinus TaxID=931585 RepID=A0A830E8N7_9EURY|nr:hypothetical protein GCM10008995_08560 [Halobellus salinus]
MGANEWFCNYCGEERSDCIECGEKIINHSCKSCSAAPNAPCENCGTEISADLRECPSCGYDAGADHEEKAERNSLSKLKYVGGGLVALVGVGWVLISILQGMVGGGILGTLFTWFMWLIVLITAGVWVLLGGSVSVLSNSYASYQGSKAEKASAADVDRAEKLHRTQEYVNEQRRKRERKERKRKEQRKQTYVQCPGCGWNVEMVVEGQVTDVQADTGSSNAVDAVGSAIDTIGADETKECPYCDATVKVSTELV